MLKWKEVSSDEERLVEAIAIALDRHGYLFDFLFEEGWPRLRGEPKLLIHNSRGFSSGEQLLIRVALDIWSSGLGDVRLMELLVTLDEEDFENVILAIVFLGKNETFLAWCEVSQTHEHSPLL